MRQSSREYRAMMEAGRVEHQKFMAEVHASRMEAKVASQNVCSLFGEALGTLLEISRAIIISRTGVTHQGSQRPVEEHHPESLPSTFGVGALPWGEARGESSQIVPTPPETPIPVMERHEMKLGLKHEEEAQ